MPDRDPPVLDDDATRRDPTAAARDQAGALLDELRAEGERYQLGDVIGAGGMGEVRSATDRRVGREVAIKSLLETADPAVVRFLREARVQGRLTHPSIVPVHDLGVDADGRPYFAMKRVHGVTLARLIAAHAEGDAELIARFPRRRLLSALVDVALAIEFAHAHGVVHRDLKPTNVMLGDFGEAWVLDWGVARVAGERVDRDEPSAAPLADVAGGDDTEASAILGTPGYIAPEQIRAGASIDHRVDVYALGAVLFEVLTLERLHPRGDDAIRSTLLGADARCSVRAPGAGIAPELDAVCVRATAIDPDERFPTMRAMADAITAYLDGDRDLERRRELVRAHVVAARHALKDPTAEGRSEAMREAGRALALDPDEPRALAIVTRLMLEPPAAIPAEVERAIDRHLLSWTRQQQRVLISAYAGFLAFVPVLFVMGVRQPIVVAVMVALLVGVGGFTLATSRMDRLDATRAWVIAIGHMFLLAVVGRLATPYLLTTWFVVASAQTFTVHPAVRHQLLMLATMLAAVVGPLLLEWFGVLSPTHRWIDGTLVIRSPALDYPAPLAPIVLTAATVLIVGIVGYHNRSAMREQRATQRQLELQAWHLRQLVAADADLSTASET